MSEFLEAAAAAVGGPSELVERSARARAAATGANYEDILKAWAGGGEAPVAAPAPPVADTEPDQPAATTSSEEAAATVPDSDDVPAPAAPTTVATPAAASAAARVIEGPPPPKTVTPNESLDWEMVTTVPAAQLKERTSALIPAWLMGFFVFIPLFAVGYIAVNSNGPECGQAGQLRVDFRDELVNCDGTAYEGAGGPGGGGGVNYVAIGADVYTNVAQCAGCHGPGGAGTGAGPSLAAITTTFGQCSDHEQWILLGSQGWIDTIGPNYGDTAKPAGGFGAKMPAFASLTPEQLSAVTVYERVVIGGEAIDAALASCGLVAAEGGTTTTVGVGGGTPTTLVGGTTTTVVGGSTTTVDGGTTTTVAP